ncbi:MAG: hypothetical protein FJ291_14040, partial [Planctomycetes bacterium]|nr:hypothetical protein [Planctomycetota bacterium]
PRTTDHGLRTTDHGLRTTDHGLRTTDHGLRTTDHGLRTMAYPAAVVAFILTTIVMAPFRLEGWWDETPEAQELRAWLDRALVVGFLACWALFFAALGRIDAPGELCRKGLACGVLAFLVHCAMDFDYQEPGVAFTAWVVAGLSVRPLRAAFAPRLRPAPAIAIVACGLVAMATFQVGLWRASRAGTERDIAASLLADAARSRSPIERAELLHKARLRYEAAVSAYPLDETLWAEYGDLLVSLLVPPDIGGEPGAGGPNSFQLRVRIETPNQVEDFARAVEAYGRAGALSRRWAAPHAHLGRLYQAAAAPDAGPRAAEALAPKVDAAIARRGRPGPNLRYLPALVAFEEALKRDPNNPAPMLLVGEAFEKLGDPEAARAFAARALSIHELLAAAHPGHKLCLTPGQAARARALAGPTNP